MSIPNEWVHHKSIVQSRLTNILGHNTQSVGARKMECKFISNKIANEFCNVNHIQGAGRTRVALGLYLENVLYSVMTFSYLNIN